MAFPTPAISKTPILDTASTVDDSNASFVFTRKPTLVVVNGQSMRENHGWSWAAPDTVLLDNPVGSGGDIYGVV